MADARDSFRGTASPVGRAQAQGDQVASSQSVEWLGRAGLLARAVVYGIVAVLAIQVAAGAGGETTDQQGALSEIARQSFGKILLVLVAIGLAGYAIWRFVRAVVGRGPESEEDGKERIGGVVAGIVYALLCVSAVRILIGAGGSQSNTDKTTGGVLGWPGGTWIIGIVGVIIIGVGLHQGYKGISKGFLEDSKVGQMRQQTRKVFTAVGVFGHLARMVVFALMGTFLVKAAIEYDPDEAIGLDGALAKIAGYSYGPVLLGIVAFGLLGFAVFSAMESRYRRV